MTTLLVLEDATITQLLRRQDVVSEFPFMSNMAGRVSSSVRKPSCKPCQRKRRQNTYDYNGIKQAIAGMPNDKKSKLKQLLNVDKLRLYYKNHRGQTVKMTF